MVSQLGLPFQYASEPSSVEMTGLVGLPLYLELAGAAGLERSVARHLGVAGSQGWSDRQLVQALLLVNLAGGDGLEDLKVLEADAGLMRLVAAGEAQGRDRRQGRAERARWRRRRERTLPSPDAAGRWLARFDEASACREPGQAFIPPLSAGLEGLSRVNADMVAFVQANRPVAVATLDMDATLLETHKRTALYCYKHYKAYQPLNAWWAEQGLVVHSEFRDGNVPAGYGHVRVLRESLAQLPAGVTKVYLRTDTAGYQQDLLKYCGEGEDPRFKMIEFAIGAGVQAGGGGDRGDGMAPAAYGGRWPAHRDRPRMGGSGLRAELGGLQQTIKGLSVFGNPRTAAPTRSGRCRAAALPDPGVCRQGPL